MRRFTVVELAIGASLLGSLMAVAIPAFCRDLETSRFVEPTEGLTRIGANAVAYADAKGEFPESAPLTPSAPPRGKKEADAPGTWDTPTWRALAFMPAAPEAPHAYAFSFERLADGSGFVAQARGDLDGDGVLSTFEIRGHLGRHEGEHAVVTPGMYIEAELE